MKTSYSLTLTLAPVLLLILTTAGCVNPNEHSLINVKLSESLSLDDFLAQDKVNNGINTDILAAQLDSPWSFSIRITSPGNNIAKTINSCADYLSADAAAEPIKANEYSAYQAAGISCVALKQALSMQSSRKSFVRDLKFDRTLAEKLPHEVALVISTEEKKRIDLNPAIRFWSDVESVEAVQQLATDIYNFKTKGATHTIKRLALGDINGDGIEDLMIRDDMTLDEGSYSASRLFLITRDSEDQELRILKSF